MKYVLCSLILFSTFLVGAAEFPTDAKIELISEFGGGLNTASPPNKISKEFSPNMANVFVHRQPGKLVKRGGFIQVGSTRTLANVRFMFTFYKETGDKEFIVSDDSCVLTTKDFNTFTTIISSLNNTLHLQATQVRNKIWFTNGSDSVFTWDGTVMQKLDGTGGTPTVPRFRYIAYYQERVFGLNTSGDGSALNWSDVASTGGVAIAPDSFLAWPAINAMSVGRGDGQLGSSLWVYSGQLQIGKEWSIYTLFGGNTSNYNARKQEGSVGPSSQDSVVLLDGLTYFKAFDGIYSYDGGQATRISDFINPDIENMLDATAQIVFNTWETPNDFQTKGQFYGLTSTGTTDLTINTDVKRVPAVGGFMGTGVGNPPLDPGTSFYFARVNFGNAISTSARVYTSAMTVGVNANNNGLRLFIYNLNTGNIYFSTYTMSTNQPITISSQNPVFDGYEIIGGSYAIKLEFVDGPAASVQDLTINWSFTLSPATTGQYVSQVTTETTVTAWGHLNSIRNTNGGTVSYFLRSSTSAINITTQTWTSISPGVLISFPVANRFIQWASTITSVSSYTNTTNIDNLEIDHVEGSGSRDRPFAINWKNEYWLSIATDTSGNFSAQYVKSWITNSNPNAWMYMQGMNIRSFAKDGNTTLYGGSASTGAFYRLDYGTNDNGQAIDAFYETPDLVLKGALTGGYDGNWLEEQLYEIWVDVDGEANNTFRLGRSLNGGSYTEQTVDVTGTGRQLKPLFNQSKFAKYFRLRFRNNQIDHSLGLNNAAVIYKPLFTR